MLAFTQASFADQVDIPFGIYVEDFKEDSKEHGFDLYGTRDSDGFIRDNGMSTEILTYKPVKEEELNIIKKLSLKHARS